KILVGCRDRQAHLWDLEKGNEIGRFAHLADVRAVAFRPHGRFFATGGMDRVVRVWETGSSCEQRAALDHPGGVVATAFAPHGFLLATGCRDGAARFWDVATGKVIGPPLFHDPLPVPDKDIWAHQSLRTVSFSPDGAYVLTAGGDITARIW